MTKRIWLSKKIGGLSLRFKSVHHSRYVHNSKYVNMKLFDVQYVRKMIAMDRYKKPDVLFSDMVKKKPVTKTLRNFENTTTVKAKINQSKITGQLGHDSIVRPCVDENKGILVKQQNVGHSKNSDKYCDSIVDMCHPNPFAVLQTVDSNSVDSNESISTAVEDACNTDCNRVVVSGLTIVGRADTKLSKCLK